MPELAEVKIMADFINNVVGIDPFFEVLEKSEVSKVKTDLDVFNGGIFSISAESRGKELMLNLELIGGEVKDVLIKRLSCSMGMSGNWIYMRKDSTKLETALKHAHLRFISTRGNYLLLYDVRRFAKWKWADTWNKGRGKCPLTEYNDFYLDIKTNIFKHKDFNKPLCEILMNQKWFNGIGNYLRAEILYRLDVNPFQPANQLTNQDVELLCTISHLCVRDAYQLGGGQLKDWYNPNGINGNTFKEWVKCYGKLSSIIDKTGRKFWYDPKWESYVN